MSDSTYEFEDPGEAWIALVEACRITDMDNRKRAVTVCLNEAKNSHWSVELWNSEQELLNDTVDYSASEQPEHPGGDYTPLGSTQEYTDTAESSKKRSRTCVTARGRCPRCGKMDWECHCI